MILQPFSTMCQTHEEEATKRVMRALIVKTSALGDVVQAFPVVEYLKARQGIGHIGWVVEARAASLVHAHPLVDTVIEIDSTKLREMFPRFAVLGEWRRQRQAICQQTWDVVFDLQGNCKSGCVTWSVRSPIKVGYGRKSVAESPNLLATTQRMNPPSGLSSRQEYLSMVQHHFGDTAAFEALPVELCLTEVQKKALSAEEARWPQTAPLWFVAVGSTWPNKMCRTATVIDVLRFVRDNYGAYFIFVAGNEDELREVGTLAQEFPHSSHVLYRPELPLLQRAIHKGHAAISVDSIILHLAATTRTPTFGFFGPSSALKYAPSGPRHGFFQSSCPLHQTFERRCPHLRSCQAGRCLKEAEVKGICGAIELWQHRVQGKCQNAH